MGSDYTLNVTCKILPEYTDFIAKEYLRNYDKEFSLSTPSWLGRFTSLDFDFSIAHEIIDLRKTDPNSTTLATLLKEVNDAASKEISEGEEPSDWNEKLIYREALSKEYNKKEMAERILEYTSLPKLYRDLIEIWTGLNINRFYNYELTDDNTFTCMIQKRCNRHRGDLRDDMHTFVKDILVPITSVISECTITVDDYEIRTNYTDLELRGGHLSLRDIIKSIKHIYDGDDIVETRVIYKRSIKPLQKIDLDRCY
jgi:hypothetical protein